MNKVIILILLLPISLWSQGLDEIEVQKIQLEMHMQETAWNRGDIKSYMHAYWNSDSLVFIGKSGINYGWNNTYLNYLRSYPDQKTMGKLTFDNVKIEMLSKDRAYVIGKWHLEREVGDLEGHYTLLWKKIDGLWKIVSDHSS